MTIPEAKAYGQTLADLYGITYYVYITAAGDFQVTPELGWTPTEKPYFVASYHVVAECVSCSPILGKERLEEEVNSFLGSY
jgi:hypothetical protein